MIDSNKYHSQFDHLATEIDKNRPELVKRKKLQFSQDNTMTNLLSTLNCYMTETFSVVL